MRRKIKDAAEMGGIGRNDSAPRGLLKPPAEKSQTLLRKAGAGSRSLAGLELRVRLADHINRSFAFHDLAIGVTALGGGK
jgi:hypothetical protein